MTAAAGDRAGAHLGLMAALIAAGAVLLGKLSAVILFVGPVGGVSTGGDETGALVVLSDLEIARIEREGGSVQMPGGISVEEAFEEADYPPEIWAAARSRLDAEPDPIRDLAVSHPFMADPEYRTSLYADSILQDRGLEYVESDDPEASLRAYYPEGIWEEAVAWESSLSVEDRARFLSAEAREFEEAMGEFQAALVEEGFKSTFSPWDLLWFFLACGTAYKLGSSGFGGD
ncbi:MAG: hypothetical protein AAFU70_01080 [Planctomycetota bacterium]